MAIPEHGKVGQDFPEGGAFSVLGGVCYARVVLGAVARFRIRIKTATSGGSLQVSYVVPGQPDYVLPADLVLYPTSQPSAVTVSAGTETKCDVATWTGESDILLAFTPAGTGTFTYCDLMAVPS